MTATVVPTDLGTYIVGQAPEFPINMFTSAGELVAPASLKVITRNPAGTETVYTAGSSSEIVNPSTGVYVFTLPRITATQEGAWIVRCNTTGTGTTWSIVWTFTVPNDPFTTPLP
jgi:hypothetical protein